MMAAAGAVGGATYIDDVFSTFLYEGTAASHTINNGIDLSGEGGMVWVKDRDNVDSHLLFDTERGATKMLIANDTYDTLTISNSVTSFNSNGFTLGDYSSANGSGNDYSSWTFRKAKGFFDVVTWTGNASTTQTISHSLGSVPGCIMAKCTSTNGNWAVYHRSLDGGNQPATHYLRLNTENGEIDDDNKYADTEPTATNFTAGNELNVSTETYIAYVFAGGESEAATARSVAFDGTSDRLTLAASTDFAFGTGDFTIECWVKPSTGSNPDGVFNLGSTTGGLTTAYNLSMAHQGSAGDNKWRISYGAGTQLAATLTEPLTVGQWYHLAYVRASGVSKLYVDGIEKISVNDTTDYSYENLVIGGYYSASYLWKGDISNFRIVKGTAVYTSTFEPPTGPLTNITNTKLLCCNNSSTTGSTVTPGTITAAGDPTALTNSPFDDQSASVFGENEDQNVIKCGGFTKTDIGSSTNLEINLGWEPQIIFLKRTDGTGNWYLMDVMRNMSNILTENLFPNITNAETDYGGTIVVPTATGFTVKDNNSDSYVYLAIRRPDGYVGKPAEAGTDVFAMDTGNGSSTIPAFDSGFPVDLGILRKPAASQSWYTSARLIEGKYLFTDTTAAEASVTAFPFDSNTGWAALSNYNTDYQSWMWKRHAGFDVVNYRGDGSGVQTVAHSLARTPEMIWVKARSDDDEKHWIVYHLGLNGGSSPEDYYLRLNEQVGEVDSDAYWNDTAPTSTHFTVGSNQAVNTGNDYLAMLFASVDGICKVGYYTGTGNALSVTTGFQPRFLFIKNASTGTGDSHWWVVDTTRGWASGDDNCLRLDTNNAATTGLNLGAPTSTGFDMPANSGNSTAYNKSGDTYIYYAHS